MSKTSSGLSKITSGKPPVNIDENNRIRHFVSPKLKRKFFLDNFLRFLVPCLVPIIILGSLSIFVTHRHIGQAIDTNNRKVLDQYNEYLQLIVSEIDSLSLTLDMDAVVMNTLRSVLSAPRYTYDDVKALRYLKNVIDVPANSKPYFHSIYVYYRNEYKRFLSSRENLSHLDAYFDGDWLQQYERQKGAGREMLSVKRTIREFEVESFSNEVVTIYKPFAGGYGLLAININPHYFESSFDRLREWQDQYIYVADAAGNRILQSGKPIPVESEGNLVTSKHIPRLDWELVTVIPKTSLYGPLRSLTKLTIVLSACSVLISALLALWLTRKNYRQVHSILNILNASDGQLAYRRSDRIRDVYELIVRNILDSFLQQKYLKVQLSERKYKEQLLELKALQSQINPHFLNNTLHSVYWKSFELTRSPNPVSQMLEQLSDMLDYALRTGGELVQLEEELIYNQSYIRIQQMRYPDRIEVDWGSIEGCETCQVLKLSLQPLLENCIQHGLESRDKLRIKLKFRMDGSRLRVTVLDNGEGIAPERMREIEEMLSSEEDRTDHVGLSNTYKRLGLKYNANAKLRILSKPGKGTAVSVWFPQGFVLQ